ncbi:MAG: OadG family protein [Clostridia bacterium]|nr:OadG family protein [Clostridia bacterium]
MNFIEKLGYGGTATVIGLLIVFAGLTIIIASLNVMAAVFKMIENRKAAKLAAAAPKAEEPAPAVPAAPVVETEDVQDESELIAVIAAAIAAFDFGNGAKPVRIKSVKRVSGWKSAARTEQLYKF